MNLGQTAREPDESFRKDTYRIPLNGLVRREGINEPSPSHRTVSLEGGYLVITITSSGQLWMEVRSYQ